MTQTSFCTNTYSLLVNMLSPLSRIGHYRAKYFGNQKNNIYICNPKTNNGALAERLGTGLQNLLERFDSARHLSKMPLR